MVRKNTVDDPGLGHRVAVGAGWMIGLRWADRVVALVSVMFLARLLSPSDFGMMSYAVLVVGFAELFTQLAPDVAVLRNRGADRGVFDAAFSINVIRGAFIGLVVAISSPLISSFYGLPDLMPVLIIIAFTSLLQGLENTGTLYFQKELNFKYHFVLKFVPRALTTIVTIALAWHSKSYWALVIGVLFHRLISVALSYLLHPFRPRWSPSAITLILKFSGWMAVHNLLHGIAERLPALVLARTGNPASLAFFTTASELAAMASTEVQAPARAALFPGFTHLSSDRAELSSAIVNATALLVMLGLPIPVGIALVAPHFVPLFLGLSWLDLIPILQILAFAGALTALGTNGYFILIINNQPRSLFKLSMFRLVVLSVALMLLVPSHGATGAALALLAANAASLVLDYSYSHLALRLSSRTFLKNIWRSIGSTALMAVAVLFLQKTVSPPANNIERTFSLILEVGIGALIYVCSLIVLWILSKRPAGAETRAYGLALGVASRLGIYKKHK